MKLNLLRTLVGSIAVFLGLAHAEPPKKLSYEMFAKLYDRIIKEGAKAKDLETELPRLSRNLAIAREVSEAHWTDSTPFDELAKTYILPEHVMDALGIRHTMTVEVMHVPAGVMHSYGYLFSQLETPFGLKGKRWIESRLDERLGLPAATFSPLAPKGEFLSNVTAAFYALIEEKVHLAHAAPKIKPTAKLTGTIVERVRWRTPNGNDESAVVSTHLVTLKPIVGLETNDVELLIYEVAFNHGVHRLVTGFPIDQNYAEALMATKPSVGTEFKPRFNLYVDPAWKAISYANEGFRIK